MTRLTARFGSPTLRWALFADPHLCWDRDAERHGFAPDRLVAQTVAQAAEASLDGALVNGDLAWAEGLREDYWRVRERFAPLAERFPLAYSLGNHDRREVALAELAGESYEYEDRPPNAVAVIEAAPVRLVLLDSLFRVDVTAGLLGKVQREWLAKTLADSSRPTVIVVHHPLRDSDSALLDAERLLPLTQTYGQVKAIFTGHDHVWRVESRARLHVVGLPSCGLPFDREIPPGWVEAAFSGTGAELRLRTLGAEDQNLYLEWRP